MRRLVTALLAATLLVMLSVSASLAVPLHQHYLTTPGNGPVPIALGICRNELQRAIDNLHANFHLGAPGAAFSQNPVTLTTVLPCP
ncbi:MAG TPA: hypothetical protein VFH63_00820 [candidate division Zixibacteria bacterium]|nr:hypothetical protein [candidate division Zixibacteria bacterium]